MSVPQNSGSVMIDTPRLNHFRNMLGWSQRELAEKSGCDKTIVEGLYKKGYTSRQSHSRILAAIQIGLRKYSEKTGCVVEIPDSLVLKQTQNELNLAGAIAGDSTVIVETSCQRLRISIDGNHEDLTTTEVKEVLRAIAARIGREPPPTQFESGSIRMTLELTPEEAERLYWAIKAGEFRDVAVFDAEILEGRTQPGEEPDSNIMHALTDEDSEVRDSAADALGKLDASAISAACNEHQDLEHIKQALRVILNSRPSEVSTQRKVSSLQSTTESLQRHLERVYSIEEEGGYMADALKAKPSLQNRIDSLSGDHERFRECLKKLLWELSEIVNDWDEPRFEHLCRDLRDVLDAVDSHNEREVELLQETMLLDDGSNTSEDNSLEVEAVAELPLRGRLELSTKVIGLAERITNCLEQNGIFTVNDLLRRTREDLLSISSFNAETLEDIYRALERIGFRRPGIADTRE